MGDADPEEHPPVSGTTAWLVSALTGMDGWKGKVALEATSLVFRPEDRQRGDTRIQLSDITQIRRMRGSPVVDLRIRSTRLPERMGLYFSQPPNLDTSNSPTIFAIFAKRRVRREAAATLREGDRFVGDQVDAFVERVRSAMTREEGSG